MIEEETRGVTVSWGVFILKVATIREQAESKPSRHDHDRRGGWKEKGERMREIGDRRNQACGA